MSRRRECCARPFERRRLHEDVVRVVGGDREDRHLRVSQRHGDRREHSGEREVEWTSHDEAAPVAVARLKKVVLAGM